MLSHMFVTQTFRNALAMPRPLTHPTHSVDVGYHVVHDPAERTDLKGHPDRDDRLLAVACLVLDVGQVEEGNVFLIPKGKGEGEGEERGLGHFSPKYVCTYKCA